MQLCSMHTQSQASVVQLCHRVQLATVRSASRNSTNKVPSTCSRRVAQWQLHAISKLNEADQPSSHRATTAAALDVLPRDLGPTFSTPKQHHASTGWQPLLQLPPADATAMADPPGLKGLHSTPAAAGSVDAGQRHIHAVFGAFFCYLGVVTAAATSPDWYLDAATFGGLWGLLWAVSTRLKPSASTATLVCLLPVMHLAGALGLYNWELGNLSWDVLVHISNGFIGTLLFASVLSDLADPAAAHHSHGKLPLPAQQLMQPQDAAATNVAADADQAASSKAELQTLKPSSSSSSGSSSAGGQHSAQGHAWLVLKVTALLLLSTSLIEVVEAAGGQVAGHVGEGIFLRGPGDFCTASLPCSEEVDTAKDMVDNCAGMMLALIALATCGGSHPPASNSNSNSSSTQP